MIKYSNNILSFLILVMIQILFVSCMEDINESTDPTFNNSADLLTYLETHGDFINSYENPALVSSENIYNTIDESLILDIRASSEFLSGHIDGAINVELENILDTLESKELSNDFKIILVSTTGQKAAYATSLLRLYGIKNIYSLDFGMGQWNSQFAQPWIDARDDAENWWSFTTQYYSKPKLSKDFPSLSFDDPTLPTDELLRSRIKKLLTEEEYRDSFGTIEELDQDFQIRYSKFASLFLICYSKSDLYDIKRYFKDAAPPVTWGGHYRSVPWYDPTYDFRASTNLLTLPVDRAIYIYSYNGQRSQYLTAYLRLLGYNAKSVKFGAIGMFYNKLEYWKFDNSFREENIKNYPITN